MTRGRASDRLASFEAKRDFAKTPEPRGGGERSREGVRAFEGTRGLARFFGAGLAGASSPRVTWACLPTAAIDACSAAIRSGTGSAGAGAGAIAISSPATLRSISASTASRWSSRKRSGSKGPESISISWRATSSSRAATLLSVAVASSSSESAGTTSSA